MYGDIALLDIASMHPSSIIAEELFGPEYTKRFQEIKPVWRSNTRTLRRPARC